MSTSIGIVGNKTALKFSALRLTPGVSITNDTTETITYSVLVPANTFSSTAFFDFSSRALKAGTADAWNLRVYKNTTNTLSGATLLGTLSFSLALSSIYTGNLRFFRVSSGTMTTINPAQATAGDSITGAFTESTLTFNLGVDNYFLVTVQLASANADIANGVFCKILGYE